MKVALTNSLFILSFLSLNLFAQESVKEEKEKFVEKDFLVLHSTTSFREAQETALEASNKLGIDFDFRELYEITDSLRKGLTWIQDTCDEKSWEYPCYVARGKDDDGHYVSVEYSDVYEGFEKGKFLVIACSGKKGSNKLKHALKMAKEFYKDASVETSKVFIGVVQ